MAAASAVRQGGIMEETANRHREAGKRRRISFREMSERREPREGREAGRQWEGERASTRGEGVSAGGSEGGVYAKRVVGF